MNESQVARSLDGKNILVTGGTGSFGGQIVRELQRYSPASIHILSRDEKKQYDMQLEYADCQNLRFVIGDVRDFQRLREAFRGIDLVYHAAALKQVPNCEDSPFEAVLTNIVGAENVRRAALDAGVSAVVSISTDKAVKPVNVMGMSKALQERVMLGRPVMNRQTKFVCVRYGNVLGSRGSVVPLFRKQVFAGQPLTITHPEMTRFLLTLHQAVELVFWATVYGEDGDLWVRKMPAAKITDLARVLARGLTGKEDYPQINTGTRPGEKLHEVLVSEEEMWRAKEHDGHFLIPAWFKLEGMDGPTSGAAAEYTSNSNELLSEGELESLLESDGWFEVKSSRSRYKLAA